MNLLAPFRAFSGVQRFWYLLAIPAVMFGVIAYYTEDLALILVFNIVLASVATAVVVVFTPEAIRILLGRGRMDRGELFAYGIWLSWGAVSYSVVETLVWRYLGQPLWLVNSDLTSARLYLSVIAGVFHILKPGELNEKLPLMKNIRVGMIVGMSVAVGLIVVEWNDIHAAWTHQRAVWFHTPGIEGAIAGPPPPDYASAADVPLNVREAMARPVATEPQVSARIPLSDLLTQDPLPGGLSARVCIGMDPRDKARLEQYRVSHGLRSWSAAGRECLARCFADDDRDDLGPYEPRRR